MFGDAMCRLLMGFCTITVWSINLALMSVVNSWLGAGLVALVLLVFRRLNSPMVPVPPPPSGLETCAGVGAWGTEGGTVETLSEEGWTMIDLFVEVIGTMGKCMSKGTDGCRAPTTVGGCCGVDINTELG